MSLKAFICLVSGKQERKSLISLLIFTKFLCWSSQTFSTCLSLLLQCRGSLKCFQTSHLTGCQLGCKLWRPHISTWCCECVLRCLVGSGSACTMWTPRRTVLQLYSKHGGRWRGKERQGSASLISKESKSPEQKQKEHGKQLGPTSLWVNYPWGPVHRPIPARLSAGTWQVSSCPWASRSSLGKHKIWLQFPAVPAFSDNSQWQSDE